MADIDIKYDVFLSFSSKDKERAEKIWASLKSNGLNVFWSDESLKKNTGQSFFANIENALLRSNHFTLLYTTNALESSWVREEYESFFSNCYLPSKKERRLIIYSEEQIIRENLPLFLRNIQTTDNISDLISILGADTVIQIKEENNNLKLNLKIKDEEIKYLHSKFAETIDYENSIKRKDLELTILNEEILQLKNHIKNIDNKSSNMETLLKTNKNKADEHEVYIKRIENENTELKIKYDDIYSRLNKTETSYKNIENENEQLSTLLEEKNYLIAKLESESSDKIKNDLLRLIDNQNENIKKLEHNLKLERKLKQEILLDSDTITHQAKILKKSIEKIELKNHELLLKVDEQNHQIRTLNKTLDSITIEKNNYLSTLSQKQTELIGFQQQLEKIHEEMDQLFINEVAQKHEINELNDELAKAEEKVKKLSSEFNALNNKSGITKVVSSLFK
jgi:hypothetical protein